MVRLHTHSIHIKETEDLMYMYSQPTCRQYHDGDYIAMAIP